jgi:DNA-binding MarR family transcriptional regulator
LSTSNEAWRIIANECLAGRARRLSRVITSLYDQALQPYGLKLNQVTIMVIILKLGEVSPKQVGAYLQMEKSTVSRNLDRMQKNGWVEVVDNSEGAGQIVRVTALGKQLLSDAYGHWKMAQKKALDLVGEEGAKALRALADRVRP